MLCRFYSTTKKTNQQVAQELDSTKANVNTNIQHATKKLYKLCGSIKDKKQLKNILEFRIEANEKEH